MTVRIQKNLSSVKHYCARCDKDCVDSDKPETGTFYSQEGHDIYKSEEYRTILFAYCNDCDPYNPKVLEKQAKEDHESEFGT